MKRGRLLLLGVGCFLATLVAVLAAVSAGSSRAALPGGTIVLTRDDVDLDCGGSLWAINPDGSNLHELVDGSQGACDPDLSPDGTHLAYVARRDGAMSIWVANADGTDPHRVTSPGFSPTWSPDGKQIAFARQ